MKIVAAKKDLKSAHRRAHLHGFLAAMSLTIVGCFALISLRLPFGGAYCPYLWCIVSESTCDLANALPRCEHWDEKPLNFRNKSLISDPKIGDDERPLAKALTIDVLVDPYLRGKVFCYIDDLITVGLFAESWKRLACAVAVALDVLSRPVHVDEPIHRHDLLSMKSSQPKEAWKKRRQF